MAIHHNKAGQYGKSEASKRFDRLLLTMCSSMTAMAFAFGWMLGYFPLGSVAYFVSVLTVAALFGLLLWVIRKPMDSLLKERIKYLRGGQAEALVAWLLQELPDDWHLFNGVQLRGDADIDHVAVGPGGVFCISTKSTRGLVSLAPDGTPLLNNEPTDHLQQVQRQTMQLRDRLVALMGDVPYVQPVLAMPLAWVAFPSRQQRVWVLHHENLRQTFDELAASLSKEKMARVVKAIEMLAANAKDVYQPASKPARPPAAAATPGAKYAPAPVRVPTSCGWRPDIRDRRRSGGVHSEPVVKLEDKLRH